MNGHEHIQADPAILCGKPVVRGTGLSVELLRSLVARGWTEQQVLRSYPHLAPQALRAALNHSSSR